MNQAMENRKHETGNAKPHLARAESSVRRFFISGFPFSVLPAQ